MSKIWISVTDFINWHKPPVGTIRFEQKLIQLSMEHLENVNFFKYESHGNFVPVSASELKLKFLQQESSDISPSQGPTPKELVVAGSSKYLKIIRVPSFREFKYVFFMLSKTIYQLILFFFDKAYHERINSFLRKIIKKLKSSNELTSLLKKSATVSLRHPFEDSDVILFFGATWNSPHIAADINKIKESKKIKFFSVCYDLIPIILPHVSLLDKDFFSNHLLEMNQCVDHYFCISKSTEKDYKEFLLEKKVQPKKTSIVTIGSDIFDKEATISNDLKSIINKKFVLCVCTIERRKNHACVYNAILYLLESGYKDFPLFVFVGSKEWKITNLIEDLENDPRIKDYIKILSNIKDSDLSILYKKAFFTVYPSIYEGWGLPVAESLSYGKFVIASNSSSIPEVGGEYAEYISPYDTGEWARRIKFYLDNPEEVSKREMLIRQEYVSPRWRHFFVEVFNTIFKLSPSSYQEYKNIS